MGRLLFLEQIKSEKVKIKQKGKGKKPPRMEKTRKIK